MDQRNKTFIPRLLPVLVGSTVDFMNNDDMEHNVMCPDGETYDLGRWTKGEMRAYTFAQEGVYTQLCNLHPEMIAYVLSVRTPYFAVTGEEGRFRIPNVPAGRRRLKVWHERFKPDRLAKGFDVTVAEGGTAEVVLEP